MKQSVARLVSRRVLHVLGAALILLLIGAFAFAYTTVAKRNREYSEAIVSVYTDLMVYGTEDEGISVMKEPEEIVRLGNYICGWYKVDYAYVYLPDVENGTVTVLAASFNADTVDKPLENNLMGVTVDRPLNKEETKLWNEERFFAHNVTKNQYGREMGTLTYSYDREGVKFLAGVDISYEETYQQIFKLFFILALVVIAILVGVYCTVYFFLRKKVGEPAQTVSRAMEDFLNEGKRTSIRLDEKGPAEFAMMAASFNRMSENIDSYIENIGTLNNEHERQQTELDIAARIQKGFLPASSWETKECDIRATMIPAKDVGGDLYDYLALDENRILITVADVSGKGIAASIFMAVTLTLIRQFARLGLSPDEILRRTNDSLSENNAAMMFATAFVGIYDSKTNCLTYANAGHNLPYVIGRQIEKLDGGAGTLLGLFAGETYPQNMIQLARGDTVFLYTDGVSESCDRNRWFYGTDRLEQQLLHIKQTHAPDPIAAVYDDLCAFSNGAERHDDITMLTLTVRETTELSLDFSVGEFAKVKEAIFATPLSRQKKLELTLAAEECFVNICSYAFEELIPAGEKIQCTLSVSDRVTLRFTDRGVAFDPRESVGTPDEYDIDTQIGGLGRYIAFANVDAVDYVYRDGQNILTMTKYFEEE